MLTKLNIAKLSWDMSMQALKRCIPVSLEEVEVGWFTVVSDMNITLECVSFTSVNSGEAQAIVFCLLQNERADDRPISFQCVS